LKVQLPAPGTNEKQYRTQSVPSIGILDGLAGQLGSGSIIIMTDADCLSGQRMVRPCLNLFEHFVDVATRTRAVNETTPSFLMEDVYRLPHDYIKQNEQPIYKTLQGFTQDKTQMIKNAKLNSIESYSAESGRMTCSAGFS
jgi:hypothetical protein